MESRDGASREIVAPLSLRCYGTEHAFEVEQEGAAPRNALLLWKPTPLHEGTCAAVTVARPSVRAHVLLPLNSPKEEDVSLEGHIRQAHAVQSDRHHGSRLHDVWPTAVLLLHQLLDPNCLADGGLGHLDRLLLHGCLDLAHCPTSLPEVAREVGLCRRRSDVGEAHLQAGQNLVSRFLAPYPPHSSVSSVRQRHQRMTTDHGVPVAQVQVRYDLAPLAQLTDGRNAGSWSSAQPGSKEELSAPGTVASTSRSQRGKP